MTMESLHYAPLESTKATLSAPSRPESRVLASHSTGATTGLAHASRRLDYIDYAQV